MTNLQKEQVGLIFAIIRFNKKHQWKKSTSSILSWISLHGRRFKFAVSCDVFLKNTKL